MTLPDPISRVSVLSTGSVQIRPEHVGPTRKNTFVWLATSRGWTAPRPINVYVIEHQNGLALFDTGQDRASVTDPTYFPGGLLGRVHDRLARFDVGPDQSLTRQLASLGHDIADVHTAVLSHTFTRTTSAGCPSLPTPISLSANRNGRPCVDPCLPFGASSAATSSWTGSDGTGSATSRWAIRVWRPRRRQPEADAPSRCYGQQLATAASRPDCPGGS